MKIEISDRQHALRLSARAVRSLVSLALRQEGLDAELSVALVDDGQIAELNRRFLERADVTDVLAFPYGCEGGVLSGEIVVNADQAVRQARGRRHGPEDELRLYIIHGLLHLLGYDDHDPADRKRMRGRESELLQAAGLAVEF